MRGKRTRQLEVMVKKHNRPGAICQLALTGLLALTTLSGSSLELKTVLENTTITPPGRVDFREERHNQLLKEPMVLTGYLEYLETGRLRKVVETPFEEAFLIEKDQIAVERDGKTRKLGLRKSKSLTTMLRGIEAILTGQADRLESIFHYELSGTDCSWSLQLTPISQRIARHLTGLQVKGDGRSVTSIRIDLDGGEWHLMDILHTDSEP